MLGLLGLGVGQATRPCPRPKLQSPGAGSVQPWALGADPRAWLQPQGERVCSPKR